MRHRRVVRAAGAMLALGALFGSAAADDLDEARELAEESKRLAAEADAASREATAAAGRMYAEWGWLMFRDASHHALQTRLTDPGWSLDVFPYRGENTEPGVQMSATWRPKDSAKDSPAIVAVVSRFNHPAKAGDPAGATSIGNASVPNDNPLAMLKAYHKQWVAGLEPVPARPKEGEVVPPEVATALADRKAWREPGTSSGGVVQFHGAAQGKLKDGARERREWFAWKRTNDKATWIVTVRVPEPMLSKPADLKRVREFLDSIER